MCVSKSDSIEYSFLRRFHARPFLRVDDIIYYVLRMQRHAQSGARVPERRRSGEMKRVMYGHCDKVKTMEIVLYRVGEDLENSAIDSVENVTFTPVAV